MEYSKKIVQLQQIYQLTPEEVAFCMLVSRGMTKGEAYAFAFRPRTTKLTTCQKLASNILSEKPGIKNLIDSYTQIIQPTQQTTTQTKKRQYRNRNSILDGIEESMLTLNAKDRAEILLKMGAMQDVKREKVKEEKETRHYYLPLQCYRCALYIQHQKEKKEKIKI